MIEKSFLFHRPEALRHAENHEHDAAGVEIHRPVRRRAGENFLHLRTE